MKFSKIKLFFRKSPFILSLLTSMLYWYIRLVYVTSKWEFINPEYFKNNNAVFILWHSRLMLGPGIFKGYNEVDALVSPHSDGQIIANIIRKFGFGIIEGSTNKNAANSIRVILRKLQAGRNIVVTPDGPRGPVQKINSSIAKIVVKYDLKLYAIAAMPSRYFCLKSWDKMIVPIPFSKIIVHCSPQIILGQDHDANNLLLEQILNLTTNQTIN